MHTSDKLAKSAQVEFIETRGNTDFCCPERKPTCKCPPSKLNSKMSLKSVTTLQARPLRDHEDKSGSLWFIGSLPQGAVECSC